MKRTTLLLFSLLFSLGLMAQKDSTIFKGQIYNDEYQVYVKMDFYGSSITVSGQDIYGSLPGYLGAKRDNRLWLITDAKITGKGKVKLSIINDFGSEDFTATMTYNSDGTYTLRQDEGSRWKIIVNRKWVKIPKDLTFKRQK